MTEADEVEINRQHAEKKARIKAARDRMMAEKTVEKGLLIVHSGNGKGKSSAAFGMALRCLGWGLRVGVVQFIKGDRPTGEKLFFNRFPELCRFVSMGEGFTWETQDRARDIAAAQAAWAEAVAMLQDPGFDFVLLDELNIALRYDYLALDEVLAALQAKLPAQHVVITGRNAKPELLEMADLATEMTLLKHPFRQGVKPQRGIEF